ncbi:MAG: hypothetical protein ABSB35_20835 [Bryobacteraceae bacterium]|jgi:hypothetical protein
MRILNCSAWLASAVALWSGSMSGQSAPPSNDWLVVPGLRVGPITASSTRADLRRLFSADAVRDEDIELDEGLLRPGTLVFKGAPAEELAIFWTGKEADAHPKEIFLCFGRRRGACRWQTPGGIRVGLRLKELEAMNEKPFTVTSFGWDWGGNVLSWADGKLAKLDCSGKLVITLDAERIRAGEYTVKLTPEEMHAVAGGRDVSSADPAMQKLNPGVVGLLYQFAGPDTPKCASP